jgi:hypothetical protein
MTCFKKALELVKLFNWLLRVLGYFGGSRNWTIVLTETLTMASFKEAFEIAKIVSFLKAVLMCKS